ncbi:hypothetical protein GCM10009716_14900 [Streptomyces sodiiphilus]|uniref:Carrier domain-containing protein n=1 Tax=Streptomyces sodiiphilus TaxID=226217 RepID=A0ABN2NYB1_9ACTN
MSADRVVAEVVEQLLDVDAAELTPATVLGEIEGWDSVNQMRVLVFLERELDAALDYERFMGSASLGELADVVADAITGTGTAA